MAAIKTAQREHASAFALAFGLHGLAVLFLAYGLQPAARAPAPPVKEVLVELISPPRRIVEPVSPPSPRAEQPAPRTPPQRSAAAPATPVAPAAPTAPAASALPSAQPAPPATPADDGDAAQADAKPQSAAPAAPVAHASPPPLVPPRFDAGYLNNPKPAYPLAARRLGEEGTVLLHVQVSPQGHPARIEVKTSSGSERLDAAALSAVARWRFIPARQGEDAVTAWVLVPLVFKMSG